MLLYSLVDSICDYLDNFVYLIRWLYGDPHRLPSMMRLDAARPRGAIIIELAELIAQFSTSSTTLFFLSLSQSDQPILNKYQSHSLRALLLNILYN